MVLNVLLFYSLLYRRRVSVRYTEELIVKQGCQVSSKMSSLTTSQKTNWSVEPGVYGCVGRVGKLMGKKEIEMQPKRGYH